jgi:plastocyanin
MKTLLAAGFLCLGAAGLSAGSITGTVTAKGPEVAASSGGGEYQSHRYSLAERIDYDHLQDFVVYIDQAVAGGSAPADPRTVTQRNVSFEPHVLPIAVGTKVLWPNKDDIFHNVFSMSDAMPFDLGLYTKERVPLLTFDKVGRVDVYCSIHSKMHCIILVLPNRFFALSDAHGRYAITNVPPGTYRLTAWHELLPPKVATVVVPAEGVTKADFVLGLSELPKY